jgi:hypothetical protein
MMAARTAAAISSRDMISGFITPLPIVVATLSGKIRNARKLNVAARRTAEKGESTFVETTVANQKQESVQLQ